MLQPKELRPLARAPRLSWGVPGPFAACEAHMGLVEGWEASAVAKSTALCCGWGRPSDELEGGRGENAMHRSQPASPHIRVLWFAPQPALLIPCGTLQVLLEPGQPDLINLSVECSGAAHQKCKWRRIRTHYMQWNHHHQSRNVFIFLPNWSKLASSFVSNRARMNLLHHYPEWI